MLLKAVTMSDNPFEEEIFPNIQSKGPLVQPEAASSHPITFTSEKRPTPHLAKTSFQVVVESTKVPLQPPFLQLR